MSNISAKNVGWPLLIVIQTFSNGFTATGNVTVCVDVCKTPLIFIATFAYRQVNFHVSLIFSSEELYKWYPMCDWNNKLCTLLPELRESTVCDTHKWLSFHLLGFVYNPPVLIHGRLLSIVFVFGQLFLLSASPTCPQIVHLTVETCETAPASTVHF